MNAIKINLVKTHNCLGVDFYTGAIKLGDLVKNYNVIKYKTEEKLENGYQRIPKQSRVANISDRLSNEETIAEAFIDCVHLNIRSQGALNFIKPINNSNQNFGDLYCFEYTSDFGKFNIEDGQTRIKGAEMAIERAIDNNDIALARKISELHVPINLTFCNDGSKEASIFYLINFFAKKIAPEAETGVLKKGFEEGNEFFVREVKNNNKLLDVYAAQVAEELNENSDVWTGEIGDFNDEKKKSQSICSIARKIKPLLKAFSIKSDEPVRSKKAVYEVVEAYWKAWKSTFPMMFDPKTKDEYSVCNVSSYDVLMRVLLKIVEREFDPNNKGVITLTSPDTYKKFISNVWKMKDTNKNDNPVDGAYGFFKKGDEGAIGKFGGNGGKKAAARKIYYAMFPNQVVEF